MNVYRARAQKHDEVVKKDHVHELFEAVVPSSELSEPAPSSEHVDSSLDGHRSLKVRYECQLKKREDSNWVGYNQFC